MTKFIFSYIIRLAGDLLKRTYKVILDKCEGRACPKSIRIMPLKRLISLNYAMTIGCLETGISTNDLIDNPTKCVEFIMEATKVNKRTAYDYYTALLYINHHFDSYDKFVKEEILKKINSSSNNS